MSTFHERLANYRHDEMGIQSKEAAALLGLSPAHYSHYENGRNKFPAELLKKLKENFGMSDEMFLEMVLERPSKRQAPNEIRERQRTIQEAYMTAFAENFFDLLAEPEVRRLLAIVKHATPEVRETQLKMIGELLDESQLFAVKASAQKKLIKRTRASAEPVTYKLSKKQTFTLVDGKSLPKLFMKTDDIPVEEE